MFDFKPDHQKENGHEGVIDPPVQVVFEGQIVQPRFRCCGHPSPRDITVRADMLVVSHVVCSVTSHRNLDFGVPQVEIRLSRINTFL